MSMTEKEAKRGRVIGLASAGTIKNSEAAEYLGISARQVMRLKARFAKDGICGMVHGNAERKPKHSISAEVRERILDLFKEKYYDHNFSHFTERLNEIEGISVSRSSASRVLRAGGIKSKRAVKRRPRAHCPRQRKPVPGIMWQTDASRHKWFGKMYDFATLHAYIDDATGIVTGAFFTENECTLGYTEALRQGIAAYGCPLSIYSDRHTIFRSTKELTDEEIIRGADTPMSNFGHALYELGIKQIMAQTPQAKGRIERLWNTFQDRLVSELRLLGVTDTAGANRVLADGFIRDYNSRFAVVPQKDGSACIPLDKNTDLDLVFSHRSERKAGGGNTISYNGNIYSPADTNNNTVFVPRSTLEVRETTNGDVYVMHHGKAILMKQIPMVQKEAISNTDERAGVVSYHKPAPNHPWRGSYQIGSASNNIICERRR